MEDPYPHGRLGVPQAYGGELALVVEDHGEVAGCSLVGVGRDRRVEEPRVPSADVLQRVLCDADCDPAVGG